MADGLFDDLIPQAKRPTLGDAPVPAASGLFDDLVPRANPFADVVGGIDTTEALGSVGAVTRVDPNEVIVPEGIAPEPPGLGESLYRRAQAGLEGILGGTSRFLGETLAPVRTTSPLVAAAADLVLPTRAGTTLTDTGTELGELAAATRAEAQSGNRPASVMEALTNPGATSRYYGGILAESTPSILAALLTRNPAAATAVAGGTTGAQSYGDLRQQGVGIPQALRQATEQGLLEAGGSQAPLERAFGGAPLGRRILDTTREEVLGEVATQLGQDVAERTGRGEDVPLGELVLGALDAALAAGPGGVVEALGGRGPDRAVPVPRENDDTLGGPVPVPQARTPAAEALDDLDALLDILPRPEAAQPESPAVSRTEPPTAPPQGRETAATYNDQFRRPAEEAATAEPVRTEGAPPDRERMAPQSDALDLRREIGWAEVGGRMIREADTGGLKPEVVGRTQWIGQQAPDGSESDFWRNRPDRALNERQANEAFDKFERGEALRPIEQRFIDHARSTAEGYARAEQEIAEDMLAYDQAEQARAVQNLRDAHDVDVTEADGADALALYELVRRNAERGVPLEELDQPQAESDRAYAARLWSMLKEAPNVDASPARSDQGGGEARRAEPPVRAAAPSSAGLFGAPSAREVVDAEARRRDAERDGRTGTGRTDMAAGGGELFAGPRPIQTSIDRPRIFSPGAEPVRAAPMRADAPAEVTEPTSAPRIKRELTPDEVLSIRRGGARFNRPASEFVDTLYRETSPDEVLQYVGLSNSAPDVHWSNEPSQALGQGENTGVTVEMAADAVHGAPNLSKPSSLQQMEQGNLEWIGWARPRDYAANLQAITVQPQAQGNARVQRAVVDLTERGFTRTENADSSVTYRRPADAEALEDTTRPDLGDELKADLADEARRGGSEDADRRGLRTEVNRVLGPVGERVEYVRGLDALPANLRRSIEGKQAQRDGRTRTAAVYDPATRRVYLLTDVVTDPARAAFHAAHEIAGHDGLRALLGDKLDPALGIARQNPTVKAVADAIASERNIPQTGERGILLATEEALAELAAAVRTGNYDEIQSRYKVAVPEGVRARLKEAIANFLKRLRAAIDDLFGDHKFSDEDVRALLENAWQAANDSATVESDAAPVESTDDYRIQHRAPGREDGAPLSGLTDNGIYPDDFYSRNGPRFYGTGSDLDAAAFRLANSYRGEPDAPVTIYRAVPEGVDTINSGDWVAIVRKYAEDHAGDEPGWHVISRQVRAGDIFTNGDSIQEWGYEPESREALESTSTDQTQTPAFRRWFGDSKVVDANGEPLVVYHGSPDARFVDEDGVFKSQRERYGFGKETGAHWFASSPETARSYMDPNRAFDYQAAEPGMVAAFLKIENPLIVDAAGAKWRDAQKLGKTGDIIAKAQADGHDGVIIRNVRDNYQTGVVRGDKATDTYLVFNSNQIKSATANRGTFDPNSASILESTVRMTPAAAEAAADVRRNDLSQTLPAGRGTIGWQYDDSKWVGTRGQASRARARLQDKMIAWRDVQDQIASQVGQAIPDTANVYRLENLMHGRVSTGIERIENAQIEPLLTAMNKAGVSQATLEEYLYARHAKERNADIAAKNPAMQDGGSGMTNAEADQILADADRATLEPLARRVDQMVRSTRQRMLDAGLISQEQFDAMEAQYSAYVPLRGKRVAENEFPAGGGGAGRGIDTRRSIVKEALGRGAGNRADNILAEVIGDAQRSVILAEKARVGRAVLRLVLANPNPTLWQVEPVQTERKTDAAGEVYESVVHDWSDPSIIAVKHRGQTYKVQINNVPLANALSNVGVDQLGAVTRAAGAINRYFSAVLTKYNPAFLPVNATRDAIFGMTAMAAEHGERAALDAALHYPQAAAAAFRHSIDKPGSGPWATWAREFADAGGQTGYVNTPSVEDLSRQINGKGQNIAVRALNKGINTLGLGNGFGTYTPTGIAKAATSVAGAIGSMNDAVENALRLSAYVTLRKRGQSIEQAAAYAKDLTVNFNRKGSDGSFWNAWFLFYNAGLQGAKRVSDVMRKPKTWAYLGALSAAQTIAMMYAMGLEDDDGENLWNKVPDHVKRRNLVIVTRDEGVVTIPMPYGFNVFTYMAGRVPAAVLDRGDKRSNTAATVASDVLSTTTESFFPVPIGDGALGLLPTVLRIPVNVQTNRDDFGREIRRESMAKYDVPRASMGKPDTLEVFKLTAQGMNRLGGGDKYTPPALSWFDVAPEDMEYLLGEVGGGAGKFVIDVATVGQTLAGGDLAPPVKPKDIPITGRFFQTIDQEASTAAQFYERRDVINRSLQRVRDVYAKDGVEAAEAALKASPELTGAAFKRRKRDSDNGAAGDVVVTNGRPQIVVDDERSVYGLYKTAEDVISDRNEGMRAAYTSTPASIIPTAESRMRDANVRQQNVMRQKAQRDFNTAWARDVVGTAE